MGRAFKMIAQPGWRVWGRRTGGSAASGA